MPEAMRWEYSMHGKIGVEWVAPSNEGAPPDVSKNAPIVPIVIRGAHECLPLGSWFVRPGIVEIEVLEAIDVNVEKRKALRRCRDELHALYLDALGQSLDPDASQS